MCVITQQWIMTFRTDGRDSDVSHGSVDSECGDVAILAIARATAHHCALLTEDVKETRKNACVLAFIFILLILLLLSTKGFSV